jgi:predicted ArsR family transcriptional regulator
MMSTDLCKYIFAFISIIDIIIRINMITRREKILNYIIEQQSATVEELSKVFRVTPANIRHHLSILSTEGSVQIIGQKQAQKRGRPTQIYAATSKSNQNNLNQLAEALFDILLFDSTSEDRNVLFKKIAAQMVEKYKPDTFNPTRRVYISVRTLNRMHYQAHWEAHISNPRIMFSHCPYRDIVENHPELCQLDTFMLQELLGTAVIHTEKLSINSKGLPECVFWLN